MPSDLPAQHRALVLETVGANFQIKTLSTPQPCSGAVIVQVLHVGVLSYHREIYDGGRHYPFPTPLVGGISAIGRVAAVGDDATVLKPGQLVYADCTIRGRDDPSALYLMGIHEGFSEGSKKLSWNVWRDGSFAEYVKMPLENCIPLDEMRLCSELGYSTLDLIYLCYLLVPYGGLRDVKIESGETVVICPATGGFGGAGVQVAVAMGARVIAMGRNEKELARLKEHIKKGTPWASIETVKITGDLDADTASLQAFGTIDAVFDISPPAAHKSTHLKSALNALRRGGRVSLMGYVDQPIVDWKVMGDNIMLKGKLMYERDDMILFVKMLERGLFPNGKDLVEVKSLRFENWNDAFDMAVDYIGIGKMVAISP